MGHAFTVATIHILFISDYMHACIMYVDLRNATKYYSCIPTNVYLYYYDAYTYVYENANQSEGWSVYEQIHEAKHMLVRIAMHNTGLYAELGSG